MITDLTPEQIIAADVNAKASAPIDAEIELKLRQASKTTSFTFRLSFQELEYLKRAASIVDMDWKLFFTQQIREKVLERSGHIAQPLITGPSFASKRITGPSA